jgi:hypothetical protein
MIKCALAAFIAHKRGIAHERDYRCVTGETCQSGDFGALRLMEKVGIDEFSNQSQQTGRAGPRNASTEI